MVGVDVPVLYEICQRLDECSSKDSGDFQRCIDAVKSSDVSTKKLAIQIVFRYFDSFPGKRVSALNTLMSQLNEPDVEVQKLVIKGLPSTCQRNSDYVDQVGDVLAQLLSARDKQESLLVRKSLSSLLINHPKPTLVAIYCAISNANSIDEKVTMLRFMNEKVSDLLKGELSPLMKQKISGIYKMMLISATPDEIELVLRFMGKSKLISDSEKLTVFTEAMEELVKRGIQLDAEYEDNDAPDFVDTVNNVVKIVLILNSRGPSYILPRKMTNYLFSKFGKLHLIHASDRKDIMKVLASYTYLGNYEDPDDFSYVVKLFDYLRGLLPDLYSADPDFEYGYVDQGNDREWNIEFTELELVSVVVYNLLQKNRFVAKELLAIGSVWKPRFQYLVNVIRVFTRRLKRKLDDKARKGEQDLKDLKLLKVANNLPIQEKSASALREEEQIEL
ncbi:apoptosis inhibitory protein 5 [Necator americanus]|uniref:Apoptosis inhibitory protein 5 n=1 Tax=Necator americanus TaxID=51031 RepID=W2TII2_NECAM|nr:apoptosis inhibitory protein 5 [Necator americanus]ETN81623.1 apoptosis inhibitory protein 5 [Necator americanus]